MSALPIQTEDTIAAIATPLGQGGIGIVRISGPASEVIGRALFRSARAQFPGFSSHTLHHGWIQTPAGQQVDEVLLSYMPGPASYTGEDVVEINCHGGPAVVQKVLQLVLDQGARLAEKGEFTLRAFLNGRMDLTQAEAVAEVVESSTAQGLAMAETKLGGRLKDLISELRSRVESVLAQVMAGLDFPEDADEEDLEQERLQTGIESVRASVQLLLDASARYRCFRDGALVVLAGRVNAGKSSLLNTLLGRNRAIVTSVPGTTRDYLEEGINLDGVPVRLVDTAGLRQTQDEVERAGLDQGEDLMQQADLVCLVFDRSLELDPEVCALAMRLGADRVLAVANKQDLPEAESRPSEWFTDRGFTCLGLSAKDGQGIEAMAVAIREKIVGHAPEPQGDELVPNMRQRQVLAQALSALDEATEAVEAGVPPDMLCLSLQEAADRLGQITGAISSEDVLEQIFSRFCIGK